MKKIKLVLEKFPLLNHTKEKIERRKKLIDLNNKLKHEIPALITNEKSPYQKYKYEKELVSLQLEQAKLYKQLSDDEVFFRTFRERLKSGIEKANVCYDEVVKKSRKEIMTDELFANKFKEYEAYDFESNWEAKISFFIELEELWSKKQ